MNSIHEKWQNRVETTVKYKVINGYFLKRYLKIILNFISVKMENTSLYCKEKNYDCQLMSKSTHHN